MKEPWRTLALKLLWIVLLMIPSGVAAVWSCRRAGMALWAIVDFRQPKWSLADWQDPQRVTELRRQIQRHFLDHRVYIPMEDIISEHTNDKALQSTALLMQKACGQGRIYVWIPFRFNLPITGEKVIEWCWKPELNNT